MTEAIPIRPAAERRFPTEFRLAGRVVQPHLNRVVSPEGAVAQVEPKVMQVLLLLVDRAGQVVPKGELLASVWEGVFVTDDVLVRAVGELRKLFEDGATPAVIETIRKRGYRLIAPVAYELSSDPAWRNTPRPAVVPSATPSVPARRILPVALAALMAAALVVLVVSASRAPRPTPRFTPLTTLEGNEFDPAVSPDGTRVAFAWDGGREGPTDLYLKMVGSEDRLRLTEGDGSNRAPVWSPDGARLAYVRSREGACDLMSVSALGGAPRRMAPCASRSARVSWSADGKWLAVTRPFGRSGHAGRIGLVSLVGEPARDLTDEDGDFTDSSPAFSPDGREVAFMRWRTDSVGDLHVVPAAGGAARRLTFDDADVMGFTWIDHGRRLLYSSNRAGMYSLWSVGSRGGDPELVAGGGRKIKHPSASVDGGLVAYEAWEYDMNLAELRAPFARADPGRRLVPAEDEWTFEPRLSPDGSQIAFASTRSGSYEIWTADEMGSPPVRLTSFGGSYVGLPRFSPDGKSIAFVARPTGQADVYAVDVAGGAPRRLTTAPVDESMPSYSADGGHLYFAARSSDHWQVRRLTLASGEIETIVEPGFASLESPDGRWLYYSRSDQAGLWRRAVAGGDTLLVTSTVRPEDSTAWGVLADGVFWLEAAAEDEPPRVIVAGPDGTSPRALAKVPEMAWPGLDLSKDARRILYSRLGRHDSNILLLSLRPSGR